MKTMCRLGIAICPILSWGLFSSSIADITGSVHFYPGDFDTTIFLAADTNYYVRVNCDLHNQTTSDSVSSPLLPTLSYVYSLPQGQEATGVTVTYNTGQSLYILEHPVFPTQTPMITRAGEIEPPFVPLGRPTK